MNTWLLTILFILLTSCLLETATSVLNIRALSSPLPEEFSTVYPPTEYRKSQVVFFNTLIDKLQPDEIVAILAHEMWHYKLLHIHKNIFASIIHQGIMLFFISLTINNQNLSHAIGRHSPAVHAGIVVFALLFSPSNLLLSILFNFISRRHESAADKYALKGTGTSHFSSMPP